MCGEPEILKQDRAEDPVSARLGSFYDKEGEEECVDVSPRDYSAFG
jgi:hypothetical protein